MFFGINKTFPLRVKFLIIKCPPLHLKVLQELFFLIRKDEDFKAIF